MLEIDGSRYSGSGTIVRQAVAFSALTGKAAHIVNARVGRPNPGLRPQHVRVVEAIGQLVNGHVEGARPGSNELFFTPGTRTTQHRYLWDIGSAGSATMLALAVLPILAYGSTATEVEVRGGLFQDYAPSFYHLSHVIVPLLRRMGMDIEIEMGRPGYVPRGGGILNLRVRPLAQRLQPLVLECAGEVKDVWGVALSSHLEERRVSRRMAESASSVLVSEGYRPNIQVRDDSAAVQPGAALAIFADLAGGGRLGADRAGAPRRPAEGIGRQVASQLLEDLDSGATVDRHAADQLVPFAALADGESRLRIPHVTDHVRSSEWLAREFLGAHVKVEERSLAITGVGLSPGPR